MKGWRRYYRVALLVAALACALTALPPLAAHYGHAELAGAGYASYAGVCHQVPARSFHLRGRPLAVCHRCAGVHAGLLAGVALYPFRRRRRRDRLPGPGLILVAAAPMVLDLSLAWAGWYENTMVSRLATGALFGTALAYYLMPALTDLVRWVSGAPTARPPLHTKETS